MATIDPNLKPVLPVEMFSEIQNHIRLLSSHVVFSQVCQFTREVYGKADGALWRAICIQCGIGRSKLHVDATWRAIASAVVTHAGECRACAQYFEVEGTVISEFLRRDVVNS